MKLKNKILQLVIRLVLGKRYYSLSSIDEQMRYVSLSLITLFVIFQAIVVLVFYHGDAMIREEVIVSLSFIFISIAALILLRTKIPFRFIPILPVNLFGFAALYLLSIDTLYHWTGVWVLLFPLLSIFLCGIKVGSISTFVLLAAGVFIFYSPLVQLTADPAIKFRIFVVYIFITGLTVVYELISIQKSKKEAVFYNELRERDLEQTKQLSKIDMMIRSAKIAQWEMEMNYDDPDNPQEEYTWSDDLRKMFGFEGKHDFPNLKEAYIAIVHPEDIKRVLKNLDDHIFNGTPYDTEYRVKKKNGEYIIVHDTAVAIHDENGLFLHLSGATRDITEVKNLIETNKEQLSIVNMALKVSKLGLWYMDVIYGPFDKNNNFTYSDEFRQLLGYENEIDFPNSYDALASRLHPDDAQMILKAFGDHLTDKTGQTPYSLEYRLIRKNGETGYYYANADTTRDEDGNPLRTVGTLFDITSEKTMTMELAREKRIIETMKDNIHYGIFLMGKDLKLLPHYSRSLIKIFSYYDSDLAGKNLLDILAASLEAKHLQILKGYFAMIFEKSKTEKVLEAANPISEFEYKVDDRTKTLSTKFSLIDEKTGALIIGIIQDVTKEREFEKEIELQKTAQEQEIKNMLDVFKIEPIVFYDFIENTESNFNYINSLLKNRNIPEKQILTKFFENIHAIKSNAIILDLEEFSKDLHLLEDKIKAKSKLEIITTDDILDLVLMLEKIMQKKDSYVAIVKRIEAFKSSHNLDTFLVDSMRMAVEEIAEETEKKVEIKAGYIDLKILETKLRKPIKDILFQCVRNSIYHGIETVDERIRKNKNPQGLLVFSLKNEDGRVELTFSDDGRGLDWDAIKKKYLKLNPDIKAATRKKLLSLIFTPEFSTSKESNLIAGQGVGLSLVKNLVKENGGTINVNSSETGLTLKFNFPMPA